MEGAILLGGRSKREFDVELGYRATTFTVPLSWYMSYQRDLRDQHRRLAEGVDEAVGKVSSVADGELFAFSDLLAAFGVSGADKAVWLEMLGCYNLPRSTMPTDIEEPCTGHANCEGFGDWVMNDDTANAFVGDTTETVDGEGCGLTAPTFCDRGFLRVALDLGDPSLDQDGNPWDFRFPATFETYGNQWKPADTGRSTGPESGMPMPVTGRPNAYVRDGSMTVTQRPENLALHGFVCDWILYLSRMAWDYSRDEGVELGFADRTAYRRYAAQLGRYAIRILASRGRLLIHELGHAHNGSGGHCGNGRDCFELASQHWLCAVSATWGLPLNDGGTPAANTWTETVRSGYDGKIENPSRDIQHWLFCWHLDPGEHSGGYVFACHSCRNTTVSTIVSGA